MSRRATPLLLLVAVFASADLAAEPEAPATPERVVLARDLAAFPAGAHVLVQTYELHRTTRIEQLGKDAQETSFSSSRPEQASMGADTWLRCQGDAKWSVLRAGRDAMALSQTPRSARLPSSAPRWSRPEGPSDEGTSRSRGIDVASDAFEKALFEEDFLGFSYGFRPGRNQHQALDALAVGLRRKKVGWVLDADIRGYFDAIDHGWLTKFVGRG